MSLAGGRYDPARQRAFCEKAPKKDFYCDGTLKDDIAGVSAADAGESFKDRPDQGLLHHGFGPRTGFCRRSLKSISAPFVVDTAQFDEILEPRRTQPASPGRFPAHGGGPPGRTLRLRAGVPLAGRPRSSRTWQVFRCATIRRASIALGCTTRWRGTWLLSSTKTSRGQNSDAEEGIRDKPWSSSLAIARPASQRPDRAGAGPERRKPAAPKNEFRQPFQRDLGRPDCAAKIYRFSFPPNQLHLRAIPPHRRGAYASSRYVECGERWTRGARAREVLQGGLRLGLRAVSDCIRAGRAALLRTAKACGSGTRGWCQADGG